MNNLIPFVQSKTNENVILCENLLDKTAFERRFPREYLLCLLTQIVRLGCVYPSNK